MRLHRLFLALTAYLFITQGLGAQELKSNPIGIYGSAVWLTDHHSQSELEINNRSLTVLDSIEMNKIITSFLSHIERSRVVRNYELLFLSDVTSIDHKTIQNLSENKYERIGQTYFDTSKYARSLSFKDNVISDSEKALYRDGSIVQLEEVVTIDPQTEEELWGKVEFLEPINPTAGGLDFYEEWDFNSENASFNKAVKYLSLLYSKELPSGETEFAPLFTFQNLEATKDSKEEVVLRNIIYDVTINCLDEYDCASKAEIPESFNYINASDKYQLISSILVALQEGKLSIYEYIDPKISDWIYADQPYELLEKAKAQDWFDGFVRKAISIKMDWETGEEVEVISEAEKQFSDITGIRFIEDWYIDQENFSLQKKVKGIVLLEHRMNDGGEKTKELQPVSPFIIRFGKN